MTKSKKHQADALGYVYSTDDHFSFTPQTIEIKETIPPTQQKLSIVLDTKHRAGKVVTLIKGFIGTTEDIEKLTKQLKNLCGTGGSTKDNIIIIQGNQKEKITQWLKKNNYNNTA